MKHNKRDKKLNGRKKEKRVYVGTIDSDRLHQVLSITTLSEREKRHCNTKLPRIVSESLSTARVFRDSGSEESGWSNANSKKEGLR